MINIFRTINYYERKIGHIIDEQVKLIINNAPIDDKLDKHYSIVHSFQINVYNQRNNPLIINDNDLILSIHFNETFDRKCFSRILINNVFLKYTRKNRTKRIIKRLLNDLTEDYSLEPSEMDAEINSIFMELN